jgi:hypothetical protein
MKAFGIIVLFCAIVISCSHQQVTNAKDLDENMMDMKVYHDNLGDYLRLGDADYSLWLLNGMDSSLQVIAEKFATHRKLDRPFRKYYDKLLKPQITNIRSALEQKDFTVAIQQYRHLTKNCNGCHIDHDVDKEVLDYTIGSEK